jgi:NTE family protein
VLLWLAEKGQLETIRHISSVSGGSLFAGLVFHLSDYAWPSSEAYISKVFPSIRNILTSNSLQVNALLRLLNPLNWRFLLSRANILAQSIRYLWGVTGSLADLPDHPVWSINGTTAENGRRFRFKEKKLGDYEIGYADAPNFPLADAMAISAAFPGGIGPLKIFPHQFEWKKRESWDSAAPAERIEPTFRHIHIYDGGVYDNLGLEPFFDVGKQAIKTETGSPSVDSIIVSDAGAAFGRKQVPGPLHPGRLIRVANIGFDQARALRVRSFVTFLQSHSSSGMYLQIGSDPVASIAAYGDKSFIYEKQDWLQREAIAKAATYPTCISKMEIDDFVLLAMHGYETAMWNHMVFGCTTEPTRRRVASPFFSVSGAASSGVDLLCRGCFYGYQS